MYSSSKNRDQGSIVRGQALKATVEPDINARARRSAEKITANEPE
jgi:hypothetical protein